MNGLLGKKIGMTRLFDETGASFAATVIEAGPCTVVQLKTAEKDGYDAVQLGYIEKKEKRMTKPLLGHFEKVKVSPFRILREFRDFQLDTKEGDQVKIEQFFSVGDNVHITGLSKGKGFAGVMKRHGFSGGPKSHGQSDRGRAPGSIGQSAYPKRVFKGMKMGGRMGNRRITISNLKILKIIPEQNLMVIKGGIPGARNSIVQIWN